MVWCKHINPPPLRESSPIVVSSPSCPPTKCPLQDEENTRGRASGYVDNPSRSHPRYPWFHIGFSFAFVSGGRCGIAGDVSTVSVPALLCGRTTQVRDMDIVARGPMVDPGSDLEQLRSVTPGYLEGLSFEPLGGDMGHDGRTILDDVAVEVGRRRRRSWQRWETRGDGDLLCDS